MPSAGPLDEQAPEGPPSELRRSPLHDLHLQMGAKMVPFGGWEMPLSYPRGTLAEHLACRGESALFDVSHLGTVRVEGPDAFDALQRTLSNDLRRISPGQAQYTHLLDADDASVLDDVIVWWLDDERFEVMPNASNTARVSSALADSGLHAEDVTSRRALLAVQGPRAQARLALVSTEIAQLGRFRVVETALGGIGCVVAGTGYTGEPGVEIAAPAEHAETVWRAIADCGATPAGLGARDTLRLEAGLPLHGHELGAGITSLQAGLGWVVRFDKGEFRGRDAALAEAEAGPRRVLRGLVAQGRRPPRQGQRVLLDGEAVGEVTSGNFSPLLAQGVALAFLEPGIGEGDAVQIDMRGKPVGAVVKAPPFHR